MNHKPYILITNDDGIAAPGIHALIMALKDDYDIAVVAPDSERSAVGHAITLSDPIRVTDFDKNGLWQGYAVSGMPADCVKIAVGALLERRPDVVFSGINLGSNTGINVIYSGTVSAATEARMLGIRSVAVSLATYTDPNFTVAAQFARRLAPLVLEQGLPDRTLLNINVPNVEQSQIRGVRITRQGMANFAEEFDKRIDPRRRVYYWMDGKKQELNAGNDVDDEAVKNNYISITPVRYDLTNYEARDHLEHWLKGLNING